MRADRPAAPLDLPPQAPMSVSDTPRIGAAA